MEIVIFIFAIASLYLVCWIVEQLYNRPKNWGIRTALAGLAVAAMAAFFLVQVGYRSPREPVRRSHCKHQLEIIHLALKQYHEAYGSFPPAFVADDWGRPLHSWRVLLLPFFNHHALYDRYHFDEPWDGPHNQLLHEEFIPEFCCPSDNSYADSRLTSYVAIVGAETAWPGDISRERKDVTDGAGQTLLIAEITHSGIHWMEPRDLNFREMELAVNPQTGTGISSGHPGGAHLLLADGKVRFVSSKLSADTIRALITAHAGDTPADF